MSKTVDWRALRERMVREQIVRRGVKDEALIDAMRRVERHLFVPERYRIEAYEDHPIPIGNGQTISQPYMVALMSEGFGFADGDMVLEVGTGSGYQAAILAEMGCALHSVERDPELAKRSGELLAGLGYDRITVHNGDGSAGLEQFAPYKAIIVTAASPETPTPLLGQLDPKGGVLEVPVGSRYVQELVRVKRHGEQYVEEYLGGCRFVLLIGEYGWRD